MSRDVEAMERVAGYLAGQFIKQSRGSQGLREDLAVGEVDQGDEKYQVARRLCPNVEHAVGPTDWRYTPRHGSEPRRDDRFWS